MYNIHGLGRLLKSQASPCILYIHIYVYIYIITKWTISICFCPPRRRGFAAAPHAHAYTTGTQATFENFDMLFMVSQFPLLLLQPRNPQNQETRIFRYLAEQIQIAPRNLNLCI